MASGMLRSSQEVQNAVEEITAPLDLAGEFLRTEGPRLLGGC